MLNKTRDNRIIALDWDDRQIRVIQAQVGKKFRLLAARSGMIPEGVSPTDTGAFGAFIREFLSKEKISTRSAVLAIPREQAIVKTLKGLPRAAADTLPAVVTMRFERELSFPASEAAIDYCAPETDPESGKLNVFVAAVRNENLENLKAIAQAAGLKLEQVELRPYANCVSVKQSLDVSDGERVLYVEIGPTMTEIDVIANGHLIFTRAAMVHVPENLTDSPSHSMSDEDPEDPNRPIRLSLGSDSSSTPGRSEVVSSLLVEVARSVGAYRTDDPEGVISHVVVSGDVGVEEAVADGLRKQFNVPTERFRLPASVNWKEEADPSGFSPLLGMTLGYAPGKEMPDGFNFIDPKRTITQAEKQLKKVPMMIAVVVLFILAGGVWYWQAIRPLHKELDQVKKDIREYKSKIKKNKDMLKLVNGLDEIEKGQLVWLDELADTFDQLPNKENIVLESIDMRQKDARLILKVRGKDRNVLTELVNELETYTLPGEEDLYFDADLGATQEQSGHYGVSGTIDIMIRGGRTRPDIAKAEEETK